MASRLRCCILYTHIHTHAHRESERESESERERECERAREREREREHARERKSKRARESCHIHRTIVEALQHVALRTPQMSVHEACSIPFATRRRVHPAQASAVAARARSRGGCRAPGRPLRRPSRAPRRTRTSTALLLHAPAAGAATRGSHQHVFRVFAGSVGLFCRIVGMFY